MILEKKYLEVLFKALRGTEGHLSLTESRMRDLFMKRVTVVLDEFYADRKKIYEQFCTKDGEGNPKIENDTYSFPKESVEDLKKELDVLLGETVELDVPYASNIRTIILGTEYKPLQGETEMIDEIISKFGV